jgi:hypothetical protein
MWAILVTPPPLEPVLTASVDTCVLQFKGNSQPCVQKFVCTTIRPTQLPFKELYTLEGAAKFVADYISYEELSKPTELVRAGPSTTFNR